MTTKYLDTTGIDLYKAGEVTLCNMMDVIKLIHHEMSLTSNPEVLNALFRMETRVSKNLIISPNVKKPIILDGAVLPEKEQEEIPGRYVVARKRAGEWEFVCGSIGDMPLLSRRPCNVRLFTAYRDASAYVDFLDEEGWLVLDWENAMSEEDRWVRKLRTPFPYDLDDGFENSLPIKVTNNKQ